MARDDQMVLEHRRFSEIEATPVRWLWPGLIARGKLTLVAGDPGLGKSQVTASLAAIISTGGRWPAGAGRAEPGTVAFLSAEDDPSDTMRPRLEAAGADLTRVINIDACARNGPIKETFDIRRHLAHLGALADEVGGLDILVVDPISAFLGSTDSHNNSDVRGVMAALSDFAAKHDCAVVAITHHNKGKDQKAVARVMGSIAFVAAARVVLEVRRDENDRERRLLLPVKNNIAADRMGYAFTVEGVELSSGIRTSRVAWSDEMVAMSADEADGSERPKTTSRLDDARAFLELTLSDGPLPMRAVEAAATAEGIAAVTLKRAAGAIGIVKVKDGRGGWRWQLPEQDDQGDHGGEAVQDDLLDLLGPNEPDDVVELDWLT